MLGSNEIVRFIGSGWGGGDSHGPLCGFSWSIGPSMVTSHKKLKETSGKGLGFYVLFTLPSKVGLVKQVARLGGPLF